jgi:hypothetical protein
MPKNMRYQQAKTAIGVLLASLFVMRNTGAAAVEDVTPFNPGSSIGAPAGLLPPPGVYGTLAFAHFDFKSYSGIGGYTGAKISSWPYGGGLLWVPGVEVFGASYALGFSQPFRDVSVTTPRVHGQDTGPVNTILNLGTLSWKLGNGFFASAGMNLYLPTGGYQYGAVVNVGRNYWTFEPKFALTYVNNGWTATGNFFLNLSTENQRSKYQTGNVFISELSVVRRIVGTLDLGIGASIIEQFSDDHLYGLTVPAISNGRSRGNRTHYASVGPVALYDFGPFSVSVTYQQAVRERNTAGGSQVWTRFNFPIWTATTPSAPALESVSR